MTDKIRPNFNNTELQKKFNDVVTALDQAIADIAAIGAGDYLDKVTTTAQSVASEVTFNDDIKPDRVVLQNGGTIRGDNANIDITETGVSLAAIKANKTGGTGPVIQAMVGGVEKFKVDSSTEATTAYKLVGTSFCMGDVTTPVGTYATAIATTTGKTLAATQTEIDTMRAALIAAGIGK